MQVGNCCHALCPISPMMENGKQVTGFLLARPLEKQGWSLHPALVCHSATLRRVFQVDQLLPAISLTFHVSCLPSF